MLEVLKTLADPSRLRLLRVLRQGDFTVQDLMKILQMGQSRISRHLRLMTEAGLLQVTRQGTWHYYRLAPSDALFQELWPVLETHLQDLPLNEADRKGVMAVMAERRERSQRFFDLHAHDWDRLHVDLLELPDYQNELLALVPQGGRIIEVGVGTGRLLPQLAAKGDAVLGIDHSPAMVNAARAYVAHSDPDKIDVRLAEMIHLPLADEEARTVVMNQVLHHAEDPGQVLNEVARVLCSGGRLVLADLARHAHDWTREQLADLWLGFDPEEIEHWLHSAGLVPELCREVDADKTQHRVLLMTATKPDRSMKNRSNQMEETS